MGYAGLATGAGAARGLEELFARMRAEEQLANQGRAIDLDEFTAQSLDAARRAETGLDERRFGLDERKLGEEQRQFNELGPVRSAQVGSLNSGARENNANAGILEERGNILRGLRPLVEAPDSTNPGALDNTVGRLRLSMAGITPSSIFKDASGDDELLDSYAQRIFGSGVDRSKLTYEQRIKALSGKPQTVIAQGNLDIRRNESKARQQMYDLRIKLAERNLQDVPIAQREMALAEFRNRIANDVKTKQTWTQWWNGEDVPDPSAQIEAIAADVQKKYGIGASGSDDLDAELARRRAARAGGPGPVGAGQGPTP